MLDYSLLQFIWFVLLIILIIGYAVSDSFDLGALILSPLVTRDVTQRRLILNAIGPVWESNQIWLILGVGATFGTFPLVYAAILSCLYIPFLLALMGLVIRPVGMKCRSKVLNDYSKRRWDVFLCLSSMVIIIVFGSSIGMIFMGLDFSLKPDMSFSLHSMPFKWGKRDYILPMMTGFLALSLAIVHASCYLHIKVPRLRAEFIKWRRVGVGGCMVLLLLIGYKIYNASYYNILAVGKAPSPNVLLFGKEVVYHPINMDSHLFNRFFGPVQWGIHAAVWGMLIAIGMIKKKQPKVVFIFSSLVQAFLLISFFYASFPFMIPSYTHPNHSLLIWDSSASASTLTLMLIISLILMPIILMLIRWLYQLMKGSVEAKDFDDFSY